MKGFHWGEWCEPDVDNGVQLKNNFTKGAPKSATAYFFYSAKLLSQAAEVLGKKADAEKYAKLAGKIREAREDGDSVGGVLAVIGALALGARRGKYDKDGKSRAIPGHSLTLAALGVFILWLGWFGFNPGSQLAASGAVNRTAICHVFLTTNLAAAAGGVATMAVTWLKYGKPSFSLTLNGVLAGLVGITAGCDMVSPAGAVIIGLICGTVLVFAIEFIDHRLHIDDPVGASSVHGVCGILGTLLTGLLSTSEGLLYGHGWGFLGAECFGILVIDLWAAACGFVLFFGIKWLHGLRVPARIEDEGLDIYEHGETCYN